MEGLAGWIDDDQRDAPRPELRAHRLVEVREDGDHAARPPGEDALDPASSRRVATLHLGQDDREVVLAGHLLHSQQDLEGPGALELVEEHLDERGAMDGPVGSLVAAIPDDRLDAPPRLGGDVGPAVDHLGDRRHGDARLLGDRRDRDAPAGGVGRSRCHAGEYTESFGVRSRRVSIRVRRSIDERPGATYSALVESDRLEDRKFRRGGGADAGGWDGAAHPRTTGIARPSGGATTESGPRAPSPPVSQLVIEGPRRIHTGGASRTDAGRSSRAGSL